MLKKSYPYLFFIVLPGLCLFLTLNLHSRLGVFTYQSEIWADRAGYYVYLPATFMARYDINRFPEQVDKKTGWGFRLDPRTHKVRTKYTYGVALMLAPSFLVTWGLSEVLHMDPAGGFSLLFHRMIDVTAWLYLVLGLFFLYRVLVWYFNRSYSLLLVFLTLAGTNLFYYGLRDTLMSHVYSFFLFSIFLFFLLKYLESKRYIWFLLLSLAGSIATLIRPTDVILFGLIFLWNVDSRSALARRWREILTPRKILTLLGVLFLVTLPQMIYWKYVFGSFFHYTYGQEGFDYFARPHILKVWFAPLNGLFLYNPLYLVMIAGVIFMIFSRKTNGWVILLYFLAISYLCGSWSTWYFGCGFGQRMFIQYLPLFVIPMGYLVRYIFRNRPVPVSILLTVLMLAMSFYNIRISFTYKSCFYGSTWDWDQYARLLKYSGLSTSKTPNRLFHNDFENTALTGRYLRCDSLSRSGDFSGQLDKTHDYGGGFEKYRFQLPGPIAPKVVEVSLWVFNPSQAPTQGYLVCTVERDSKTISYQSTPLDCCGGTQGTWYQVSAFFSLAAFDLPNDRVFMYVTNSHKNVYFIDDMTVKFF